MSSIDAPARTTRVLGVDVEGLDVPGVDQLPHHDDGTVAAAALLVHLQSIEAQALDSDYDVLELVSAWERVSSWVSAQQLTAMAEFARRPDVLGAEPELARASRAPMGTVRRNRPDDEIGAQLSVSRVAASIRLGLAVGLADRFEATARALEQGRIDVSKARVIVDECSSVERDHLDELQSRLLARAPELTPPRLHALAQRLVMTIDPDAAEQRSKTRRSESRVIVTPQGDGVAELWAQLPAEHSVAIETVVHAVAKRLKDSADPADPRTLDQWRAEALAMPFVRALRSGTLDGETPTDLGTPGRSPVRVNVSVPASVLLGLSDAPGDLQGHGPIPASLARLLAQDATWRRILTDEQGLVTDVGTTTYRPGTPLARTVQLRHQRCVFPGCGARAERCDLDHVVRHPEGPTSLTNLAPECRRHHLLKHRDDLHDGDGLRQMLARSRSQPPPPALQPLPDGALLWTLPTGHQHTVEPPPLVDPGVDRALVDSAKELRRHRRTSEPGADLPGSTHSRVEAALERLLAA